MRNFLALSDVEFESVCADLLQEELGTPVERFGPGADAGIDLRWDHGPGLGAGIGQCKHYTKSTFAQLLAAAKDEVPKVAALNPARYIFITSQSLVVTQKQKLFALFSTWMKSPEDIWSGEYIDGLLTRHKDVELRHTKLWLNSGTELYWATHSGLMNRSAALAKRAAADLFHFVPTKIFDQAREILVEERVCLIAGPPGVGKTMLAHALIASAMQDGYEPIEISNDVNEGWDALDRTTKQFFIYDDFLGQIALTERLGKKEDNRLVEFINEISRSKHHRFVLTTREYILRDAEQTYPLLSKIDDHKRLTLSIPGYERLEKGKILYSHMWHSKLPDEMKKELSQGGWKKIVDHNNYSPRLIQYAAGNLMSNPNDGYLSAFVAVLDDPRLLWTNAYDNHLDNFQQSILLVLCSFGFVPIDRFSIAVASYTDGTLLFTNRKFTQALKALDQTFVKSHQVSEDIGVTFHSPAVREFLLDVVREDDYTLGRLVGKASYFDQLVYLARAGAGRRAFNRITNRVETTASKPLQFDRLGTEFVKAVKRLLPLPSGSDVLALAQERQNNLGQLLKLPSTMHPENSWWDNQFRGVCRAWLEGIGSTPVALDIMRYAEESEISKEVLNELKKSVVTLISVIDLLEDVDWSAAVEIYQSILGLDFPDDLSATFHQYVIDEIDAQGMQIGNLSDLKGIAEDLHSWETLESIQEHEERLEEYADAQDHDGYDRSDTSDDRSDGSELESMFNRFS